MRCVKVAKYRLVYECSLTGVRVYSNGAFRKTVYADGTVEIERITCNFERCVNEWKYI